MDNKISFNDGILTIHYPSKIVKLINYKSTNQRPSPQSSSDSILNPDQSKTPDSIEISSDSDLDLIVDIDYGFFNLSYNCTKGGFNYFAYNTVKDPHIDIGRVSPFQYDEQVGELCHYDNNRIKLASNTDTYKSPKGAPYTYDRGHGNHQNIWDHDENLMKITNNMSNIVPQESTQNRRGLWRHSEVITQCYRQNNSLYVIGGNIWGNDESNDYFTKLHGVVTPDYLFKIIIMNNETVYAFVIPNDPTATPTNSSQYMTSIHEIEKLVNYKFDVNDSLKNIVSQSIPQKPKGCSIK